MHGCCMITRACASCIIERIYNTSQASTHTHTHIHSHIEQHNKMKWGTDILLNKETALIGTYTYEDTPPAMYQVGLERNS